jgi:hypothetical protein
MKYTKIFLTFITGANLLVAGALASNTSLRSITNGYERHLYDENVVLCRIVVFHTSYGDSLVTDSSYERRSCVPIVGGQETEFDFPIHLPEEMKARHAAKIETGQLMVLVSPATFENNTLTIADNAEYFVVDDRRLHHLTTRHLIATGTRTVAFVRVSTSDATPAATLAELQATHFDPKGLNLITQYDKCSRGKLKWTLVPNGMIDVKIPSKATEFVGNIGGFTTVVQQQLKDTMFPNGITSIADKIIMCLPPGSGNWAASAGLNHWRVQMNNFWCSSLSASIRK